MQAFKKVGVIIALSALSLSSAWAAGEFTAEAELDGFQVVPPVLTAKQTEAGEPLCLTFPEPPPTPAATGEVLALIALPNPWKMKLTTAIQEVRVPTDNIRLYFGQPFANGRPIATLCDNKATPGPRCAPEDDPAPGEQIDFGGNFELNDI